MQADGARSCPIRKRRSARAASANRRWAPGYGAVLNAIADAIGVDAFRRAPVTSDIVLMSLDARRSGCTNRCSRIFGATAKAGASYPASSDLYMINRVER